MLFNCLAITVHDIQSDDKQTDSGFPAPNRFPFYPLDKEP